MSLVELLTFYSVPNIDHTNNKLYVDNDVITIPMESYKITDIEKYLQEELSNRKITFSLKCNNKTLCSVIKCCQLIDFRPEDSIRRLLGFTHRVLRENVSHILNSPVSNLKINALRVECNTTGAYLNGQAVHKIHQFYPTVPPGYKIVEVSNNVIYLPVTVKTIDYLELRIVDQDGKLVDFRNEVITIRLHIKSI